MPPKTIHPNLVGLFHKTPFVHSIPVAELFANSEQEAYAALDMQDELISTGKHQTQFDVLLNAIDGYTSLDEVISILKSKNNKYKRVGVLIHEHYHPDFTKVLNSLCISAISEFSYVVVPNTTYYNDISNIVDRLNMQSIANSKRKSLLVHAQVDSIQALRNIDMMISQTQLESAVLDLDSILFRTFSILEDISTTEHFSVKLQIDVSQSAAAYGRIASFGSLDPNLESKDLENKLEFLKNSMGFSRIRTTNIKQLKPIIQHLSPSKETINKVIEILEQGFEAKWKPITYMHKLIAPHTYRNTWNTLMKAKLLGCDISQEIINKYLIHQDQ